MHSHDEDVTLTSLGHDIADCERRQVEQASAYLSVPPTATVLELVVALHQRAQVAERLVVANTVFHRLEVRLQAAERRLQTEAERAELVERRLARL